MDNNTNTKHFIVDSDSISYYPIYIGWEDGKLGIGECIDFYAFTPLDKQELIELLTEAIAWVKEQPDG
jgi:hypothetical protein